MIDHAELEQLKTDPSKSGTGPTPVPRTQGPASRAAAGDAQELPATVRRLLKLRVPVRVQLAQRKLSVAAVRRLSLGAILEFARSVDDPLALLINNQRVGEGEAVKVGEHFGLRLKAIRSPAQRIQALGPAAE